MWTRNDTLKLNYDPQSFVIQVAPGAEFARFGPSAIKARAAGPPMPFEAINRLAEKAFEKTDHTIGPIASEVSAIPQFSKESQSERSLLLEKLRQAEAQIRKAL